MRAAKCPPSGILQLRDKASAICMAEPIVLVLLQSEVSVDAEWCGVTQIFLGDG